MRRAFLFSSGIVAILVGVFSLAYLTSAATTKYKFNGVGTVISHDFDRKLININFTKMSKDAADLALGNAHDVRVGGAKLYKKNAKGKLVRVKQGNFVSGDRVKVEGAVKSDDTFHATRVELEDTSFTMTGKLRAFDRTLRRITIDVETSTYKSSRYKDKQVIFSYAPDIAKFYTRGKSKSVEDVTASDQKVRVEGKEVGTTLDVTSMNELP